MNHLVEFLKQNPSIRIQDVEDAMKMPKSTLLHAVSGRRELPNKYAVQRKQIAEAMEKIYNKHLEVASKIAEFLIIEENEKDME